MILISGLRWLDDVGKFGENLLKPLIKILTKHYASQRYVVGAFIGSLHPWITSFIAEGVPLFNLTGKKKGFEPLVDTFAMMSTTQLYLSANLRPLSHSLLAPLS